MEIVAAAIVNGGVSPTYKNRDGFAGAITRAGAGDYTLTLDNAYAEDEIAVNVTIGELAVPGTVVGLLVSGNPTTTIQVKWEGEGDVGVDVDYSIIVTALPVS